MSLSGSGVRLDLSGFRSDPPFILCDVHDPVRVEDAINPFGFTVGENWCSSSPEQEQPDGRWKLYVDTLHERLMRVSEI